VHQPQTLVQRQTEQAFDAQAKLDGLIHEGLLTTTFAAAHHCMSLSSQFATTLVP
jgi:hypothetical protein